MGYLSEGKREVGVGPLTSSCHTACLASDLSRKIGAGGGAIIISDGGEEKGKNDGDGDGDGHGFRTTAPSYCGCASVSKSERDLLFQSSEERQARWWWGAGDGWASRHPSEKNLWPRLKVGYHAAQERGLLRNTCSNGSRGISCLVGYDDSSHYYQQVKLAINDGEIGYSLDEDCR